MQALLRNIIREIGIEKRGQHPNISCNRITEVRVAYAIALVTTNSFIVYHESMREEILT